MARLPCSLLIASLTLASVALPVSAAQKLVLTPEDFAPTVASGYWFIEHFSPWCHHCQDFMPLWDELVEDYAGSDVRLVQIDCSVNGDLCTAHGVNGYPQMNLYKDGELLSKFSGVRTRERLTTFIADHSSVVLVGEDAAPSDPLPAPPKVDSAPPKVESAPLKADVNPDGKVVVLTPQTFKAVVGAGDVFVKFYAPWCGHCKKLAPIWTQLAAQMQHKLTLAEVDCDAHKALCTREGVSGFPMLFFYPPDHGDKAEYTGNRKLDPLKAWAERAIKPAMQELAYDDYEAAIARDPVAYLFLHPAGDTSLFPALHEAARPLLGSPPIYTSSSPQFLAHFSLPASTAPVLLALKDHDGTAPTAALRLSPPPTTPELARWLVLNKLPTFAELGDGTFQEIMRAPAKPLVVLLAAPAVGAEHESLVAELQKLAMAWRRAERGAARPVVFAWMDQGRWAKWLKSMYGIKGAGRVVIADHQDLKYYDVQRKGKHIELTAESLFPALDAALAGALPVRHSENVVERFARYLNAKFIALETFATEHTLLAIALFVGLLAGVFYVLKRLIIDEDVAYHVPAKGRLD
ncbi:thioredoxin-domain-containing protein [Amylostereum chailletii]|nr:thioredoxin-domain-containing protein [Amylostereum chailletii]